MTNEEVLARSIFLCYVGSYSYGTNLPSSDMDEGGVCIPTKKHYLRVEEFEQANSWKDADGNKIDKTIYSLDKIVDLCLNNNPNCLDYLFAPDRSIIKMTPEWMRFMEVRDQFLSTKCKHSFSGYAYAQFERIKTHKQYLRNAVKKPTREEFGLPKVTSFPDHTCDIVAKLSTNYVDKSRHKDFMKEMNSVVDNEVITVIRKYVDPSLVSLVMGEFKVGNREFLGKISSISGTYLKDEYNDMARKELAYMSAYNNWKFYSDWEKGRNPARQELERKCGYDSKHASHGIRLMRMCVELLEGKGISVDRTGIDADYLKEIRMGNVAWEDVYNESVALEAKATELYTTTKLPRSPNKELIQEIKCDIIEKYVFEGKRG